MTQPGQSDTHELRVESAERMQCIEKLASYIADDDCESCEGWGLDDEGAEWTLCECVLEKIR